MRVEVWVGVLVLIEIFVFWREFSDVSRVWVFVSRVFFVVEFVFVLICKILRLFR